MQWSVSFLHDMWCAEMALEMPFSAVSSIAWKEQKNHFYAFYVMNKRKKIISTQCFKNL